VPNFHLYFAPATQHSARNAAWLYPLSQIVDVFLVDETTAQECEIVPAHGETYVQIDHLEETHVAAR
jgi:hypothetical protein